ncbi:cysteine--tRNA ligase [Thermodesulfobacteriota bacterium]
MTLKLYNTAIRKKEIFKPIDEGKVKLYVCGVTVYDLCHIGHARSAIVFDVLVRYMRARGFEINYVRNFTDIDDKIIARAHELGKQTGDLAQEFINAFYDDMDRLYVMRADTEPKATEHIDGMIDMIKSLLERGHAYVEEGDVFFSVESFNEYGALSGRKLEDMQAGTRFTVDTKKRHPLDFVLWKAAKPDEPKWDSPWGQGRPGWHIECSVMSNHFLGPSFDIHGGGKDLLFPHHENERAQSIGANGGEFAKYWVHNGFVTVESEKMSKSTGNFLTIRDALEKYHPQVLRLFLLSKHYRSPLDFSKKSADDLQSGLVRIYRTLQRLEEVIGPPEEGWHEEKKQILPDGLKDPFLADFIDTMDDDLNTAGALGLIFEKVREMNRIIDSTNGKCDKATKDILLNDRQNLFIASRVLGLLMEPPASFFDHLMEEKSELDTEEIEKMIAERETARSEKDWTKADLIRNRLKDMGVVLEDGPKGTVWRIDV